MRHRWWWTLGVIGVAGYWAIWPIYIRIGEITAHYKSQGVAAQLKLSRLRRDCSVVGLLAAMRHAFPKTDTVSLQSERGPIADIGITAADLDASVAVLCRLRTGAWVMRSITVDSTVRRMALSMERVL